MMLPHLPAYFVGAVWNPTEFGGFWNIPTGTDNPEDFSIVWWDYGHFDGSIGPTKFEASSTEPNE
jgi:hypothetical protein